MTNEHTEQSERAKLIRHMVNRFLAWKLPKEFNPDSFISFDREKHDTWGGYPNSWPSGTNLFTADQAKAMLEYLMDGCEPSSKPAPDFTEAINAPGCERIKDFYSVGPVQRAAVESFAAALLAADKEMAEQRPISDATEAVIRTVIEVEKLLCEKLGRKWAPSGMSIQTLVEELAADKAGVEVVAHYARGRTDGLQEAMIDWMKYDNQLRFIQRCLEGDAPKSDRDDAAKMVRSIRVSVRPQHQPSALPDDVVKYALSELGSCQDDYNYLRGITENKDNLHGWLRMRASRVAQIRAAIDAAMLKEGK